MNIEDFKSLSSSSKRSVYLDLKSKKEDHYKLMLSRVQEDVSINKRLWEDLKGRLIDMYTTVKENIDEGNVDSKPTHEGEVQYLDSLKGLSVEEHINRCLTFLMMKTDTMRLRESTKIKIDLELLDSTDIELTALVEAAAKKLQVVMPPIPEYKPKKYPKKPFLKDGVTLSASGISWNEAVEDLERWDDFGTPMALEIEDKPDLKLFKCYNPPNIGSSQQIKDWLFSKGWKPQTFKYVKDEEATQIWVDSGFRRELKPKPRLVPQLSVKNKDGGSELCPSVLLLEALVPEISAYSGYTLTKHRYDVIQGFKAALDDEGYVAARVGGLANTLREKHRKPITNLPNVKKAYGENIRGLLTCESDEILAGSDINSLEDAVKNCFCLAYDPDYVTSVNIKGYDAHTNMAVIAGFITREEEEFFKWFKNQKS